MSAASSAIQSWHEASLKHLMSLCWQVPGLAWLRLVTAGHGCLNMSGQHLSVSWPSLWN